MKKVLFSISMIISNSLCSQNLYENWRQNLKKSLTSQQDKVQTADEKELFKSELEFLSDTHSYSLVKYFFQATLNLWQQDTLMMIFKENTAEFKESWIYLIKKDSCIRYQLGALNWKAVKYYPGDQTFLMQQLDKCLIPKNCDRSACSNIDDWVFTIGDRPIIFSKFTPSQFEVRYLPSFCADHISCIRLIWSH
jgi:hypothetical protein